MIKVLTVSTLKGGVGKTASSVSIAGCLAERFPDKKVMLLDLDPQGNASINLGYTVNKIDGGTRELFENKKSKLKDLLQPTQIENLFILPAEISLGVVEFDLRREAYGNGSTADNEENFILRDKIRHFERDCKEDWYCVIDTAPSLGILTTNAYCASDKVIAPVTPDINSVAGLTFIINSIESVRLRSNPKLRFMGLFRSIWGKRNSNNTKMVDEYLQKKYPDSLFDTLIPDNNVLKEAALNFEPVNFFSKSAPVSKAYREFTDEIVSEWEKDKVHPVEEVSGKTGFLKSLYHIFTNKKENEDVA